MSKKTNPFLLWRRKAKLTQKEAAEAFGVTVTTIHNWESGSHLPRWNKIVLIAGEMGIKPSRLLSKWVDSQPLEPA